MVVIFRRDGKAEIFEPLPGAEHFVNPPVLTVIFEEADADFDDLVAIAGSCRWFRHLRRRRRVLDCHRVGGTRPVAPADGTAGDRLFLATG
jgi:hypothetical protein